MSMPDLHSRRSIRYYTDHPLSPAQIESLLEAAIHAPSAHNSQPWRFAVLTTPESKERLALAMGARFRAEQLADGVPPEQAEAEAARSIQRITHAPSVIVACLSMADMRPAPDARRARLEHTLAVQSVAAAVQNLLLAAHQAGLGACWMCAPLFAPEEVRAALNLPDDWEPQSLVTLGQPAESPRPKEIRPWTWCTVFR